MSFTNDNQPQEIESFEINGQFYAVYEIPGCSDFLDLYKTDANGYVEIDYPLATAKINNPDQFGVIDVEFYNPDEVPTHSVAILKTIKTRQEKLLNDVTEAFKTLLKQ